MQATPADMVLHNIVVPLFFVRLVTFNLVVIMKYALQKAKFKDTERSSDEALHDK